MRLKISINLNEISEASFLSPSQLAYNSQKNPYKETRSEIVPHQKSTLFLDPFRQSQNNVYRSNSGASTSAPSSNRGKKNSKKKMDGENETVIDKILREIQFRLKSSLLTNQIPSKLQKLTANDCYLHQRFVALSMMLKIGLTMELTHTTIIKAIRLFDIIFVQKLTAKSSKKLVKAQQLKLFFSRIKVYATTCLRIIAHLVQLRTMGNNIIQQYQKLAQAELSQPIYFNDQQQSKQKVLKRIFQQVIQSVNENIPIILSSSDEILDLLIIWFKRKMQSISGWSNMGSCQKSFNSKLDISSSTYSFNGVSFANDSSSFIPKNKVPSSEYQYPSSKPQQLSMKLCMFRSKSAGAQQVIGTKRLKKLKKLTQIRKGEMSLEQNNKLIAKYQLEMQINDLLHLPRGSELSGIQLPLDLCFRNLIIYLCSSKFFMVNSSVLAFIAFVNSLQLKLPFFLQQVQQTRGKRNQKMQKKKAISMFNPRGLKSSHTYNSNKREIKLFESEEDDQNFLSQHQNFNRKRNQRSQYLNYNDGQDLDDDDKQYYQDGEQLFDLTPFGITSRPEFNKRYQQVKVQDSLISQEQDTYESRLPLNNENNFSQGTMMMNRESKNGKSTTPNIDYEKTLTTANPTDMQFNPKHNKKRVVSLYNLVSGTPTMEYYYSSPRDHKNEQEQKEYEQQKESLAQSVKKPVLKKIHAFTSPMRTVINTQSEEKQNQGGNNNNIIRPVKSFTLGKQWRLDDIEATKELILNDLLSKNLLKSIKAKINPILLKQVSSILKHK